MSNQNENGLVGFMMNYLESEMRKPDSRIMLPLKYKILDARAKEPSQANALDAGHDMFAIDDGEIAVRELPYDHISGRFSGRIIYIQYKTGIAIEPPIGYHTELFPRSSVSKKDLVLANSIGLVDEGYRNEILFRFKPVLDEYKIYWGQNMSCQTKEAALALLREDYDFYKKGERIGQIVLRKTEHYAMLKTDELSDSERGMSGLGSSGS